MGSDYVIRAQNVTVAVCGLGGLGSNIAVALCRSGIGRLLLYDFDQVDASNIHRQHYAWEQIGQDKVEAISEVIWKIYPSQELVAHKVRLAPDNAEALLGDADIVIEAFDAPEEKAMLANFVLTHFPEKYFIAASGLAGTYSANEVKTRCLRDRFYVVGDLLHGVSETETLVAPRVMVAAGHVALMVVRLIQGEEAV